MRYELTVGDLVEAVQEHLDLDPRFALEPEGAFPWNDDVVLFVRLPDEFQLTWKGETFSCVRF